jgi:hypothetical protein
LIELQLLDAVQQLALAVPAVAAVAYLVLSCPSYHHQQQRLLCCLLLVMAQQQLLQSSAAAVDGPLNVC